MIRLAALALLIGGLIKGAGDDYVGASSALVLALVLAAISAHLAQGGRRKPPSRAA